MARLLTHPHRARWLAMACVTAWLTGCAPVGPNYQAPTIDVPTRWHEAAGEGTATDAETLRDWWHSFHDPLLTRLVAQTLAANQDLGIARAHLQQARAERIKVAAALGPSVSAGAEGNALRSSTVLDWPPGIGQSRTWRAGFDASWELDIFGGARRAVEAADAGIDALNEDRHALQVSLLAELVTDYAALRTAQARAAIAQDNIRNLREGERLAELARQRGLGTLTEVAQARAEREAAEARPPLLDADVARLSHAIGVLTGGFAGDWRDALASAPTAMPRMPAMPVSLPSAVIRQRPDLRADERRLAAATANIGVAQAERFPHFRIPLGIGTTASLLSDLFSGASLAWSVGLQASQSLYDGGRAKAGVTAAQARADAALLVYERDVRRALREVEDALTRLNSERRRQVSLQAAVDDSQQALDRATRLYRRGLSGYLPVLTAQRAANSNRDALAVSRGDELHASIALYKALGAGWTQAEAEPARVAARSNSLDSRRIVAESP